MPYQIQTRHPIDCDCSGYLGSHEWASYQEGPENSFASEAEAEAAIESLLVRVSLLSLVEGVPQYRVVEVRS